METLRFTIGGRIGRLFEGEIPETYCFVPENCLAREGDGVRVLEGDYLRSGWDVRNMRFNEAGEGQHLFPNPLRPIVDPDTDQVRRFLRRLEQVHAA